MGFIDYRIPTGVKPGVRGGPSFSTSMTTTASGQDNVSARWTLPKGRWSVEYGIREMAQIEAVRDLFYVGQGRFSTFRFRAWEDWKSCSVTATPAFGDQSIGTGTGALLTFQLRKTYTVSGVSSVKNIYLPVSGTVLIGINGVNQASGWSVNTATGIVTFTGAPGNGLPVTAGYEYDHEVRFADDNMVIDLTTAELGGMAMELIEHWR